MEDKVAPYERVCVSGFEVDLGVDDAGPLFRGISVVVATCMSALVF